MMTHEAAGRQAARWKPQLEFKYLSRHSGYRITISRRTVAYLPAGEAVELGCAPNTVRNDTQLKSLPCSRSRIICTVWLASSRCTADRSGCRWCPGPGTDCRLRNTASMSDRPTYARHISSSSQLVSLQRRLYTPACVARDPCIGRHRQPTAVTFSPLSSISSITSSGCATPLMLSLSRPTRSCIAATVRHAFGRYSPTANAVAHPQLYRQLQGPSSPLLHLTVEWAPYNYGQMRPRDCNAGLGLLLVAATAVGAAQTGYPNVAEAENHTRRFLDVFGLLRQHLAQPFDPGEAIYRGALPAMVNTLDPFSAFLDARQLESLREMQRSTEKGFGSVVNLLPGRVIVLQTLPESPSERAGIAPGDEILALNGQPLAQLPVQQLVPMLANARQDRAHLMVKRPNFPNLLDMTLVPAEMADPSVSRHFLLERSIAYAKILNFEAATASELRGILGSMGGQNLSGLVLDLRGNPGGIIESAVQVAAFFLRPNERILWIHGREGAKEALRVPTGSTPYAFPLRVLIDGRTASAAELVAGALQDHGRARLVGQRSFGKGLVQSVFELSGDTALALTTAFYETPSERSIQRWASTCGDFQLAPCDEGGAGRQVRGGINPDREVGPRPLSEFERVLLASNSFLEFARDYVSRRDGIDGSFEPDNEMLDDFQVYLSQRHIRPTLAEWSSRLEFIRSMLRQEALNLTVGVAAGDEIEIRRDPVVAVAVEELLAETR